LLRFQRESKSGRALRHEYDLGKWYNAFEEGSTNGARLPRGEGVQARMDRARARRYSVDGLAALRKKGYTPATLATLQQKGFSEQMVLSLATKGFSEQMVLSLATKGFSEQMCCRWQPRGSASR
jgi:hypothetical protein